MANEMPEKWQACGVCARKLERHEDPSGVVSWLHPTDMVYLGQADHPAVPVDEDAIQTIFRCDFDFWEHPQWELPVKDFDYDFFPIPKNELVVASVSAWACCDQCAEDIRAGNWKLVTRRSILAYEGRFGPIDEEGRTLMRVMHYRVRKNVTGEIRPMHPRDPYRRRNGS